MLKIRKVFFGFLIFNFVFWLFFVFTRVSFSAQSISPIEVRSSLSNSLLNPSLQERQEAQKFLANLPRPPLSGMAMTRLLRRAGILKSQALGPMPQSLSAPLSPSSASTSDIMVNNPAGDTYPNITQSETSISAVPPYIVETFNDSSFAGQATDFTGYSYSSNGGATWTDGGTVDRFMPSSYGSFGDGVVAHDRSGNFYLATLATCPSNPSVPTVVVLKSQDKGATWSSGFSDVASSICSKGSSGEDKPWIAVGPNPSNLSQDVIYAAWTDFNGSVNMYFSKSADGGSTWSSPKKLPEGSGCCTGTSIAVDPSTGKVYAAYEFFGSPIQEHVVFSTNAGSSWSSAVSISSVTPAGSSQTCDGLSREAAVMDSTGSHNIRIMEFPSIAVGQDSTVYATWNDGGLGQSDILVSKSTNGGASWTSPVVADSVVSGMNRLMPSINVNSKGLWVSYINQTENNPAAFNITQALSTNGGST